MVEMLGFRDQREHATAANARLMEYAAKWSQAGSVYVQEFVLIELHFHRKSIGHHRYTRATIVGQEILKIAQMAGQNGKVNLISPEIGVKIGLRVVAAFENDMNEFAQRRD